MIRIGLPIRRIVVPDYNNKDNTYRKRMNSLGMS